MNPRNPTLLTLFLILLLTRTEAGSSGFGCRRRPFKLTEEFCANIPTAQIDLHAFAGIWFQIFLTVGTDPFQVNQCMSGEYEVQGDGFAVLFCAFTEPFPRPRCLRSSLVRRPGGGPGSFILGTAPNAFNLDFVALLGSKSWGYFAVAAFQCNRTTPRTPGLFIIARKPFLTKKTLKLLKKKLRCLGFPLPRNKDFKPTRVKRCKYHFNKDGFDEIDPL